MMRRSSWTLGVVSAILILASCSGKNGSGPTNPAGALVAVATATPAATPMPTAAPTATAAPTPQPGGEEADNPGPVATVFTRVFVVRDKQGGEQIPGRYADQFPSTPYYDEATNTERVPLGTFFILDTTPKNPEGKKCCVDARVEWVLEHGGKFEPLGVNGIGSNPFQYRANARAKGVVPVFTYVDGVRSNVINVEIY